MYSVCFSPDGKQLVSGSLDETVRLWDVETGACVRTLEGHGGVVTSVTAVAVEFTARIARETHE